MSGGAATTALPVDPPAGFRAVLANPGLLRIEIAWALGIAGEAAFTVALLLAAVGGPTSAAAGAAIVEARLARSAAG